MTGSKRGLEGKRRDVIGVDPWSVCVVGVDKPFEHAGLEHPRYDPRVKMPLDEATIESMLKHGQISPIHVAYEDVKGVRVAVAVAGRRRTLMVREAWTRQKAAGVPEKERIQLQVMAPLTAQAGWSLEDLDEVQIIENEHRTQDDLATVAEKVAQFVKRRGGGKQAKHDAAMVFKRSPSSIDSLLNFFGNASPVLKAASDAGKIGDTVTMRLAALPPAEQPEALQELMDKGDLTADGARNVVTARNQTKRGTPPDETKAAPSRKTIKKILAKVLAKDSGLDPQVDAFVRWLSGEVGPRAVEGLPALLKELDAPKDASDKAAE